MTTGFSARYRQAFASLVREPIPSDGYSNEDIKETESSLGVLFPKALRDYYALVGRHRFNQIHNRLLSLDDVFLSNGHLAFMEENQVVVYWSALLEDKMEDPPVFQATEPEGPWHPEKASCSDFLLLMLYWQGVGGGLAYTGFAERVELAAVREVEKSWNLIASVQGLSAYGGEGQAICVLPDSKTCVVHVGARSREDLKQIEKRLSIALNETSQ